jgi:Protein of unknown function (DUF1501)
VTQDPNSPNFKMDTFALAAGIDSQRVDQRRELLEQLDLPGQGDPIYRRHREKAFEMLTSGRVATAFRLHQEPDRSRKRYGRNPFGQTLLLARRLVEVGVPIIQANMGIVQSWDTHVDNWGRLKNQLLPWLDRGLAALVDDLKDRGRLDETLLVVVGEFGRTPKVSTLPGQIIPGRDHWASVYSGLFAGAGVKGGRAIGKSDRVGAHPITPSYTPFDIGSTIYQSLGIKPETVIRDALNRPTAINAGKPMDVLFRDA